MTHRNDRKSPADFKKGGVGKILIAAPRNLDLMPRDRGVHGTIVPCPQCGAPINEYCSGLSRPRSVHLNRRKLAVRVENLCRPHGGFRVQ